MADKEVQLGSTIDSLADSIKANGEKDREVLKYELTTVKLNEPIDPGIKATTEQFVAKIIAEIDPKSHGQHAEHYITMIKLYYTSAINTIANDYQQQITTEDSHNAIVREEFAKSAKEKASMAIAQIQSIKEENGGWLGDEGIVALHKASMQFNVILRAEENKDLTDAFAYTLKAHPTEDERKKSLKALQNTIADLYGSNTQKSSKETALFVLANLTHNDRRQFLAGLKEGGFKNQSFASDIFAKTTFAEDANKKGALTLSEMEFFLGNEGKFTDEQRQKYNDTYLKARASIVDTRGLKGGYGDKPLLDSVTPGSIALFLADAIAVSSFALNAGFAIGSGNPMDIFENTWTRLPAAWMVGRHMVAKEKPISEQLKGKEETIATQGQKALAQLNALQSNTLAFEPWEPFLTDETKAASRLKTLQEFILNQMRDRKLTEVPDKIEPQDLIDFLQSDPKYAETLSDLQPILRTPSAHTPEILAKVLYSIHHFRLKEKSISGLTNAQEFEDALAASQEKL
ncbi:hypothetical protein KA119_01345 [Candidatus Gracilibacteria bacterium]|nr:hypothetical protein [Candidatus Gracilibacteria bacterium]